MEQKNGQAETILIIDDDPGMTAIVHQIFASHQYQTIVAHNYNEVFQLLADETTRAKQSIDLILLDLMMPGMSGIEMFKWLRAQPQTANTPIIILTAVHDVERRIELFSMGADDYLVKPCSIEELLARAATHIKIAQLRKIKQQADARTAQLYSMSQVISSSLDMSEVLTIAMDNIRDMLQVEMGSIILRDEKTNNLSFASTLKHSPSLQEMNLHIGEGIVGQVIQTGEPLLINDAQNHPSFSPFVDQLTGEKTRSILCVPLIARDQVIGAVELINKKDGLFNDMDLTLVSSAATSIAIAIDNARLYREQAELIREVQQSQERLVQSERMSAMGRLAASLAHEINNPLQAVHSCLQLATHFNLSQEKQTEYLGMAEEEVERLIDIVTRILDFARPSGGVFEMANINAIIGQVIRLSEKQLSHQRLSVQQNFASDIPPLRVVPNQIAQVFLVIILNAFDAMSAAGTLIITTRAKGSWVEISFQDDGVGMSPELQARIFEPFYSTKNEGTGLGLAVSYGIVERHGGKLYVESEEGKGSTFTVCLPRPRV
ncbi:MAG: response regulator [Ardenticatenaceae bacterium]|nr:response regulator [Anaerolineales bacterium]MCB8923299.1 response regulator [Ardenticatenaceae bacterium]MCB8992039.1 response regulator [Ardenticatenaceae bacterium]MCB9004702.1 response regulator [Ardenticatenaceae bacterium]